MSSAHPIAEGFCFSGVAVDGRTKYIVNVCGHDSLERPLAKNMTPVPEQYLDERGIDNLIIPISVSEPLKLSNSDYDYCVDVTVHSSVLKRCRKGHPFFEHFITRLIGLSVEWIQQECGAVVQLKTCKLLDLKLFIPKGGLNGAPGLLDELKRAAEALSTANQQMDASKEDEGTTIPGSLRCATTSRTATKNSPLIQEVVSKQGVQKGFLLKPKGRLYDQSGSHEGEGKVFDQLSHIPESLRNRCKIIDTSKMNANAAPAIPTPHPPPPSSSDPPSKPTRVWQLLSLDQTETHITLRLNPPNAISRLAEVDLSVTEQSIDVDGFHVDLPCTIDVDNTKAKYLKSSDVLLLTCSVLRNST